MQCLGVKKKDAPAPGSPFPGISIDLGSDRVYSLSEADGFGLASGVAGVVFSPSPDFSDFSSLLEELARGAPEGERWSVE